MSSSKYHNLTGRFNERPRRSERPARRPESKGPKAKKKEAAPKLDICDCLDDTCPGCHFQCSKCGSTKCGLKCRAKRRFSYESIKRQSVFTDKLEVIQKT